MADEPEQQEHDQPAEHDQPLAYDPQFEPSPRSDQPGNPPPAKAPSADAPSKKPAPQKASSTSLISNALMMIIGAALAAGGFGLARVYAPPKPPGEVAGPPDDMVKKDDFKKLTDRVDQMNSDLDQAKKEIQARPDYSPQLKLQGDRLNDVAQTVTEMSARFDSVNQKLETMGKVEGANSTSRVDAIDKRLSDLANTVNGLKTEVSSAPTGPRSSSRGTPGNPVEDVNLGGLAMEQAGDLYKNKKYAEAHDAFMKLTVAYPNDPRVWYFAALSNGFATNQWRGETERLVNLGMEKEKSGQVPTDKIDGIFTNLTPATGKDWLAVYRSRISTH